MRTTGSLATLAVVVSAAVLWIPHLQSWGGAPFSRPDADIVFAYQALLLGGGAVQGDTAHHGYVYFLFLSWWYRLAYAFGALPAFRISDLSGVPDVIATFAQLVVVGRVFSVVLGIAFAVVFAFVLWRITRDRLVTLVVGIVFALGEGLAFQTIVLRTELVAMFLLVLAFAALLMAVSANASRAQVWLFLAGLFASLSYNSKVQVLFPLLALPILVSAFGESRNALAEGKSAPATSIRVALMILFLCATPGWIALVRKIGVLGSLSFVYVPAIIGYCLACIALYGRCFGIARRQQYAAVLSIYCGFGVGLALLFLHRHPALFAIDANPIEHMSGFLLQTDISASEPGRLGSAVPAIVTAVLRRIWVDWFGGGALQSPYRLSFWLSAGLTAALVALRLWKSALQVALLIALASFLNGVNSVRYGQAVTSYSIFVDPWIFLAIGVATAAVRSASPRRDVQIAITAFFVLTGVVIAHRNIEAGRRDWAQPAANICVQADGYLARDIAEAFRPLCR